MKLTLVKHVSVDIDLTMLPWSTVIGILVSFDTVFNVPIIKTIRTSSVNLLAIYRSTNIEDVLLSL